MTALRVAAWLGNACYFSRFLVQWWASERAGRSVAPRVFWWLSLVGALLLGAYAFDRGEEPLLAGYAITFVLYLRNLWIGWRGPSARRLGTVPALLAAVAVALLPILLGFVPDSAQPIEPGWLLLGFAGQALWSSRFVVQWWLSERAGHSHFPRAFWWLSLGGNTLLLLYALHRADAVFIAGFAIGPIVQVRNLMLGQSTRSGAGAAGAA